MTGAEGATRSDKADSIVAMKPAEQSLRRPALFLDRDGVINIDHGYVHRPEAFEFVAGIFDLVRTANRGGYRVVVVTNQSGIGRGYFSESQFHDLTGWMKERFVDEGGWIDAVYFCPFHPVHGIERFRRESIDRKPGPGMLLRAKRDWHLDMASSILIGDRATDLMAGRAAGVEKLFLLGKDHPATDCVRIDYLAQVIPSLTTRG